MVSLIALLQAIILGIVEGVTEFLPISSTGHLRLCQQWMGQGETDPFWSTFAVFIQIGAILSVVVYFRRRLLSLLVGRRKHIRLAAVPGSAPVPVEVEDESNGAEIDLLPEERRRVLMMLAIAALPSLVIGYLTHDWIEKNLSSSLVIAAALLLGGVLMILAERIRPTAATEQIERVTWRQAIGIGFAQVLAVLFPGTSRSAATIIGGMAGGLSRNVAAEFSFLLAIPVMFAACGYKLLKFLLDGPQVSLQQVLLLVIGALVSYLVAWSVIDWFMGYVRRHTFLPFALYRIGMALVVLLAAS